MIHFQPTAEMREIRGQARRLYDQGYRMVGEWCQKLPNLTMRLWSSWEKTAGFLDWQTDLFPEHSNCTVADLRSLEFEANKALMNALTNGDLQAVNLVIKMSGLRDANKATEDTSMNEWFEPEADGGWSPPIAEAK